ncbi:hypothetical protein [Amycolatopsis sp. NBC_00438]|uniref:hypothetical protein n=1 Tax=Amycolatopsis sp. NBC_00438 TaxID=2903558 RepID=UPI002E23B0FF
MDDRQGLGLFDPTVAVGRGAGPTARLAGAARAAAAPIIGRGERADTPMGPRVMPGTR